MEADDYGERFNLRRKTRGTPMSAEKREKK